MALSHVELGQLAALLERVDNTQIRGPVWKALVKKFPTVPIELVILDKDNCVFMAYRDDNEFKGWQFPGSVWNDWETLPERRQRLVEVEVIMDAGIQISEPKSVGWVICQRGDSSTQHSARNACALMHVAYLLGEFVPKQGY